MPAALLAMPPVGDLDHAIECRDDFRRRGYNPVPSSPYDNKRPLVPYAEFWESPIPEPVYLEHSSRNFQVMCGRHWGLLVIDLDGRGALGVWDEWVERNGCPPTWQSCHGPDGQHVWFSVDRETTANLDYRVVWGLWDDTLRNGRGDWKHHKRIDLLGDRRLVSSPPSVHSKSRRPYRWLRGPSPADSERPALAPSWVLELPDATPVTARPVYEPPPPRQGGAVHHSGDGQWVSFNDVHAAIPDKIALAREWGLRVVEEPRNGWASCKVIGRLDRKPSGRISERGSYWEPEFGRVTLTLFQLGVSLGQYTDIYECKNDLAVRYGLAKATGESTR